MLIYNVFGRYLGVKRVAESWQVFRVDRNEGKHSRLYNIIIPDELSEAEIPGWLGDIFHEAASEQHPDVTRVE
ncbi:hypothetical protein GA0061071_10474 [Kosakonia oryzendophytica]|uniref:DUF7661 domain-containing protein n=1 Tax=Kosakonia oryzendophytica TaxID=1005665 RepID=A0A1C4B2N0_9ENTR|nr:hypothetical protein [Kosakonia oryzendophytica]AMO48724.1 Hypothetical protein AKI40_2324 [Enterobacter sp. FY-07]AUP76836.1 hypothetical protein CWS02_17745 [Enterobacter sp. EA-1]TDT60235.1 hypothetical protein DFO53_1845 [Enterobacter sp. AG5470]WBT56760.1 hypothetical protein O9K67_16480 [Kosakonia oryzendophytica]SCC01064.1 hypothetical protein GA0061071_10474 [Kosakonia oryzendophytica]